MSNDRYGILKGLVSCDPSHNSATVRVRVTLNGDPTPIAIKASFRGYDWQKIRKGDCVTLSRSSPSDKRAYRIVKIHRGDINPCAEIHLPRPPFSHQEAERKIAMSKYTSQNWHGGNPRNMSKDRVRFFVGNRYYDNCRDGANYSDTQRVLLKAFGISLNESHKLMDGTSGFWIVCRPSQFARFLIYRNEAGLKNGFMDLAAKLQPACGADPITQLAADASVSFMLTQRVVQALGMSKDDVWSKIGGHECYTEVDVSKYPSEK